MSDKFLKALEDDLTSVEGDNLTLTENGAVAFRSTTSKVLDFFATGGAMRVRDEQSVISVFQQAYAENPVLATKALFYFRDVRGGQGERKTFRLLLNWLANNHPEAVRPNIGLIAEYGRWDDLYSLVGTGVEDDVWAAIDVQLAVDRQSDRPSLLAKWLKSENASSPLTKSLARKTRSALGMSSRTYRKMLSSLRKKIDLVEQKISANRWAEVEYDRIPSKAGMIYRNAFRRHDGERYMDFIGAVNRGEAKINAGTLYPYEIAEKVGLGYSLGYSHIMDDATIDAMWNALPDYFAGTQSRGIVVADVSGSMSGRPMAVSVSLALYVAERNTGPFHNKFITFSARPSLQTVEGRTISEKMKNLSMAYWDMNTNLEAVFDLILNTAVRNKLSQDELPTHLYIVSDMEFDQAVTGSRQTTLMQSIEQKFIAAGYRMPFLVFWNVYSRNDQQPMSMDQRGFQLVSGCSPSIFTSLLSNKTVSAYDLMIEVLEAERYAAIKVE
jgi:hypothetical protein